MSELTDQLAAVITEHSWCSCETPEGKGGWQPRHIAEVLAERFVVLPKDQLHREWTVQGICQEGDDCDHFGEHGEWVCGATADSREEAAAFPVAKDRAAQVFQRWVGLWRPADSKEKADG